MISGFLESWGLFQWTYLAAFGLSVALGILGVLVVTRGQVFIAAAVSQASMLGVAVNIGMGWGQPVAMATVFGGIAAWTTARRRTHRPGVSGEETTAWLYLFCGGLAILILAKQPIGLKEVQAMMASSVLGASPRDAVVFGTMALLALALPLLARGRLVLLITDPTMAAAVGLRVGVWAALLAGLLGIVIGWAVLSTGLLFTFGGLVLPALAAKSLCRDVAPMFWVAPTVALSACVIGFVLAHHWDFPPGQVVVALLALVVAGAWIWREARDWFWG